MKADLHMHSIYSDGKLNIDELIDRIIDAKLDVVALTDHDTIYGVEEYKEKLNQMGRTVVVGLELSTKFYGESIHILGYFKSLDAISPDFKEYLIHMKDVRYNRLKGMIENVNRIYGFNIDFNKIVEKHPYMLERPHLADAIENETGEERQEIFKKYIGNDSPAYIPVAKITPLEGVNMIHKAGGVAILAHPYCYKDPMSVILSAPFDGLEVFYGPSKLDKKQFDVFYNYAKTHNMFMTGGSDYHQDIDKKHSQIGTADYKSPYVEEFLNGIGVEVIE